MLSLFGGGTSAGLHAIAKKKWKRARALLETPASEGDGQAAYHLGLLLWRGLGGAEDRESAVYWFRRAAEDDLPAAQDALGVAFQTGAGVEKDAQAARVLFQSAAERGYGPALANLAALSEPREARSLLTRAAKAGHVPSILTLCGLLEPDEPDEALTWLYVAVALTGEEATAKRAKTLARELAAADIAAAQARGRDFVKQIERAARKG